MELRVALEEWLAGIPEFPSDAISIEVNPSETLRRGNRGFNPFCAVGAGE